MVNTTAQDLSRSVRDPHIVRDELVRRLNDPRLTVVNVMPAESFRAGHIPNSINLPVAEIGGQAHRVLPDPAQEIAVYCAGPT